MGLGLITDMYTRAHTHEFFFFLRFQDFKNGSVHVGYIMSVRIVNTTIIITI